jgi:hypothetical protein
VRRVVLAVVLVGAFAARAEARDFWSGWAAAGGFELSTEYATSQQGTAARVHHVSFGETGRAVAGKPFGLAIALDARLGFEVPGAFVYRFQLSPLGLGVPLGLRGYLGVTLGVGPDGAVDRVPFAV